MGCLLVVLIVLLLVVMGDMAYIYMSEECLDDDNIVECLEGLVGEEAEPEGETVTATGNISGEYGKSQRSVDISLTIPLKGGKVTGSFSGDCDGSITGDYAGNGGAISGKAKGACAFIMPAWADWSGTVNTAGKTVPVNAKGGIPGFTGEKALTLKY